MGNYKTRGYFYLTCTAFVASSGNTVAFMAPLDGHVNSSSATETDMNLIIDKPFTIRRIRGHINTNSKNAETTMLIRDDAADITGTSIAIAASTTGKFDSGALSLNVVSGSAIAWELDRTASASGSIGNLTFMAECS